MTDRSANQVSYKSSPDLMNLIRFTCEALSLEFTRWDEQYAAGPSLYFLVVADVECEGYTDPLGANRWPIERCGGVLESPETFVNVARDVAFRCDGAVLVAADGTVQEQMVRVRTPNRERLADSMEMDSADWMGTKHLSALEISTREEVLWSVTLSEETGRVSSFRDGAYQDYSRTEIGGRWRSA